MRRHLHIILRLIRLLDGELARLVARVTYDCFPHGERLRHRNDTPRGRLTNDEVGGFFWLIRYGDPCLAISQFKAFREGVFCVGGSHNVSFPLTTGERQ